MLCLGRKFYRLGNMKKPERYVRQQFINAVTKMTGNESFQRRVMNAWSEVLVLVPVDFDDPELREHYEFIARNRVMLDSTDAECEEVRKRVVEIFLKLEMKSLVPDVPSSKG